MAYFDNNNCHYNRYLKQLDQNKTARTSHPQKQPTNKYGQYKIEKPKNPIIIKSIYTEDESQFYQLNTNYDEVNQEDIYEFIENSKTLKEKIYEKLDKGKKNKNIHRAKIVETTFRPCKAPKSHLKENTIYNNLSNRKSLNKQQYTQRGVTIERKRIRTQIEEANALWKDNKNQLELSKLNFYERQEKTVTNRQEYTKRIKDMQKEKQMEGCTFKPQLTKYRPKRS